MGRGKSQPLSSAIATDQLATEQPIYMLCGRLARSQGERLQQEGPPRAAWCGDAAGGLAAQNVGQAGSSSLSFLPRNCPLLSDRPGSLPSPHSPPRAAQLLEMPPSHPMGGGAGETETQQDIQVYSEQIPQQPRQQEPEQGRWVRDWGETGQSQQAVWDSLPCSATQAWGPGDTGYAAQGARAHWPGFRSASAAG